MQKKQIKIKGMAKAPVSFGLGEIGVLIGGIIALSWLWPVGLRAVIAFIWKIMNGI